MSVPSLEKIPMVLILSGARSEGGWGGGRANVEETRQVGVVLRDGHRHVVEDGLELVEVQVLELEGVDEDDRLALDSEGAVHHLRRVELEQGAEELFAALRGHVEHLDSKGEHGA